MSVSFAAEPVLPRVLSVAEWADLDQDVEGELVDGQLVEDEMPSGLHEMIVAWLWGAMASWIRPRGGVAFGAELKLAVGARRGRKADASMYLPGRPLPARDLGATRRAPSVVVEVISPRPRDERRDVVDKKQDYAAFGVPFYWIVNPRARTFEVFELGADGRYTVALTAAGGAHAIPGCDGLVLDLDALWASGDSLPESEPEAEGE